MWGGSTLNWEAFTQPAWIAILTHVVTVSDEEAVKAGCNSPDPTPLFVFLNAPLQFQHLTALVSPAACFRAPSASQDCCTWLRFTR